MYRTVGADFVSVEWGGIDISSVRYVQYVITYRGLKSGRIKNSKRGRVFLRKYMRTYWFGNLSPVDLVRILSGLRETRSRRTGLFKLLNCGNEKTFDRSFARWRVVSIKDRSVRPVRGGPGVRPALPGMLRPLRHTTI